MVVHVIISLLLLDSYQVQQHSCIVYCWAQITWPPLSDRTHRVIVGNLLKWLYRNLLCSTGHLGEGSLPRRKLIRLVSSATPSPHSPTAPQPPFLGISSLWIAWIDKRAILTPHLPFPCIHHSLLINIWQVFSCGASHSICIPSLSKPLHVLV